MADLSPGDILRKIPGLTRDKLSYWVLKRYVPAKIESSGNRNVTKFEESVLPFIQKAYELIVVRKIKDREAFQILHDGNGLEN